jgi:hypothetical protein
MEAGSGLETGRHSASCRINYGISVATQGVHFQKQLSLFVLVHVSETKEAAAVYVVSASVPTIHAKESYLLNCKKTGIACFPSLLLNYLENRETHRKM